MTPGPSWLDAGPVVGTGASQSEFSAGDQGFIKDIFGFNLPHCWEFAQVTGPGFTEI
jgi:hypothetical protein